MEKRYIAISTRAVRPALLEPTRLRQGYSEPTEILFVVCALPQAETGQCALLWSTLGD